MLKRNYQVQIVNRWRLVPHGKTLIFWNCNSLNMLRRNIENGFAKIFESRYINVKNAQRHCRASLCIFIWLYQSAELETVQLVNIGTPVLADRTRRSWIGDGNLRMPFIGELATFLRG